MQDSDIPSLIGVAFGQFAGGSYIRTVPVSSQIGIQDGAASFHDGFVPLNMVPVDSGGVPPFGQDMNGVLNVVTKWVQWGNAGGPNYYNSAFSSQIGGYPKYAMLNQAGQTALWWISTVDNNASDPDTGGANWQSFPSSINVAARTVTASGSFSIGSNDSHIALRRTISPAPSFVTLPVSANGRQITIEDVAGNLSAYICTVSAAGSGTLIADLSSFIMNIDRQSVTFTYYSDSNEWSAA